jgi:hypothetical protein
MANLGKAGVRKYQWWLAIMIDKILKEIIS